MSDSSYQTHAAGSNRWFVLTVSGYRVGAEGSPKDFEILGLAWVLCTYPRGICLFKPLPLGGIADGKPPIPHQPAIIALCRQAGELRALRGAHREGPGAAQAPKAPQVQGNSCPIV